MSKPLTIEDECMMLRRVIKLLIEEQDKRIYEIYKAGKRIREQKPIKRTRKRYEKDITKCGL